MELVPYRLGRTLAFLDRQSIDPRNVLKVSIVEPASGCGPRKHGPPDHCLVGPRDVLFSDHQIGYSLGSRGRVRCRSDRILQQATYGNLAQCVRLDRAERGIRSSLPPPELADLD